MDLICKLIYGINKVVMWHIPSLSAFSAYCTYIINLGSVDVVVIQITGSSKALKLIFY